MSHRLFLIEALKKKKERNPLFSLRAMAKQISVSPAHLSQLLSGKRPLTVRVALKIAEKLDITPADKTRMLNLAVNQKRDPKNRFKQIDFQVLSENEFSLISDWYYYAILSLSKLEDNQASAKWIASQLGIAFSDAKEAFEKLKMMGYIEEKDGKYFQSSKPLHSTRDVPSPALRKFHKQNLDLAKDRMDLIPVKFREFSSMTMPVSRKQLQRAKKLIHEFKIKLSNILERGAADDVYTLAIQLFPVTMKTNKGEK